MKKVGDTINRDEGELITHVIDHADDEDGTYVTEKDGKQYLIQLNEGGQNGTRIAIDVLEEWMRRHRRNEP